jgi:hypothetical protein
MIDGTHPDTIPLMPSRPWLSEDGGQSWRQLDEAAWIQGEFTSTARIEVPEGTLRVAAFRPSTLEQAMAWCDKIEELPFVTGRGKGLPEVLFLAAIGTQSARIRKPPTNAVLMSCG